VQSTTADLYTISRFMVFQQCTPPQQIFTNVISCMVFPECSQPQQISTLSPVSWSFNSALHHSSYLHNQPLHVISTVHSTTSDFYEWQQLYGVSIAQYTTALFEKRAFYGLAIE
jgi:hypothetical protein